MAGVHLDSLDTLTETHGLLEQFKADLNEELLAARRESMRALDALMQHEKFQMRAIENLEQALRAIGHQLGNDDATRSLRRQIGEAKEHLRKCRSHKQKIEECMTDFSRNHKALASRIEHELPKSQQLLLRLRAHAERYSR